jgi:glycosyltransferase involved in cell wall biosynthesis
MSESRKVEELERATITKFDKVVWVTEQDRQSFATSGVLENDRDVVIPIATDPGPRHTMNGSRRFRITFLGGLHWPPNSEGIQWFGRTAWPEIAGAVPSAVLTVVGKGAPPLLGQLESPARVEVKGYLPSIDSVLDETAVFIVPLLSGAGMRVKILDAWRYGLPVVSTTLGAEGLECVPEENILIADSPREFKDAVIRLATDHGLRKRLGDAGRDTVERVYDWRRVYKAWDEVYH